MSKLADLLHALEGNSVEFQMLAVRQHVALERVQVMYAQRSQWKLYQQGQIAHIELHAACVFPFTERVEVSQ